MKDRLHKTPNNSITTQIAPKSCQFKAENVSLQV